MKFLIKSSMTTLSFSVLGYALIVILMQFNHTPIDELQALKQKYRYIQQHQSFTLPVIQSLKQPALVNSSITNAFNIYLPTIPSYLNPKKGLGISYPKACEDMQALRATWYYNWTVYPDPSCNQPDTQFIPMIYDGNNMLEPNFSDAIKNAQASGWLMGFNEPNLPFAGNLTPEEGAIYWKQIEDVALPLGIKLVSPAPNPYEPGEGLPENIYGNQWTWAMVEAYQKQNEGRKPHFDAFSWHMYHLRAQGIADFVTKRHQEALERGYDVPVWLTEYSALPWRATEKTPLPEFLAQTTAWLNETPWIERYAWFANRFPTDDNSLDGWRPCSLLDTNMGHLTELGQIYWQY